MTSAGDVKIYTFWNTKDKAVFLNVYMKADIRMLSWENSAIISAIVKWKKFVNECRQSDLSQKLTNQAIDVMKHSIRKQRTAHEKDILKKFITAHLTCVPSDKLNASDMERLCNEVDWNPLVGKSIIFLQGDFGNVYYMIAKGSVSLYLEPSKDKEMQIAREFANHRGQFFSASEEECLKLGNLIFTLPAGSGFGEYAILNTTQKLRSCTAVANDESSILLVLHADTYDAVLRKFHTRQRQLNLARSLLTELPLFSHAGFSKISSIAYTLKCQIFTCKSFLGKTGNTIACVYLIISGEVKVISKQKITFDQTGFKSENSVSLERNLPSLAYSQIGRGFIIGEMELYKGSETYLMDYIVTSAECEVFEMPLDVYRDFLTSTETKEFRLFNRIEHAIVERDQRHQSRINRASAAMKLMVVNKIEEIEAKNILMGILPSLITNNAAEVGGGHGINANSPRGTLQYQSSQAQPASTSYYSTNTNSNTKFRTMGSNIGNSTVTVTIGGGGKSVQIPVPFYNTKGDRPGPGPRPPALASTLVPNMANVIEKFSNNQIPGRRTPANSLSSYGHAPKVPETMMPSNISPRKKNI